MTGASVPPTFVPNHLRPLHKECDKVRVALATVRGGGSYRDKEFSILYCPVCGLGFSDPIPTEETAHLLYDNRESCDFQPNESRFVTRLKAMVARRDVRSFCDGLNFGPNARLLDYGCGNGAFTCAMHEVFPNVQVIGSDLHTSPPPMLTTCNYVQYSRLSDMQNCFDLILCRHVLEHSYDPVGLVAQLASHLKPGGVLAVEVPSLETKVKSLFGKYWDGYYAPFHTVHFCRDSLAAILERAGLRVFRQGGAEMPKMGRSIQNVLGWEYNVALFAAGILLQPLQIGIGLLTGTSVCLRAWARKPID